MWEMAAGDLDQWPISRASDWCCYKWQLDHQCLQLPQRTTSYFLVMFSIPFISIFSMLIWKKKKGKKDRSCLSHLTVNVIYFWDKMYYPYEIKIIGLLKKSSCTLSKFLLYSTKMYNQPFSLKFYFFLMTNTSLNNRESNVYYTRDFK